MVRSLPVLLLSLLVAAPVQAQTSPDSLPAPTLCRPGDACVAGQTVAAPIVALAPADARALLLDAGVRLETAEADLLRCQADREALRVQVTACDDRCAPCPAPPPVLSPWPGRIAWGASGVLVGIVAGVAMALSL